MTLKRQLVMKARQHAERAVRATLTDHVIISHTPAEGETVVIYTGPARIMVKGDPNVLIGDLGTYVNQFAEVQVPNGSVQVSTGDTVSVTQSIEPQLVGRIARVQFSEPVNSLSGVQRITVQF